MVGERPGILALLEVAQVHLFVRPVDMPMFIGKSSARPPKQHVHGVGKLPPACSCMIGRKRRYSVSRQIAEPPSEHDAMYIQA